MNIKVTNEIEIPIINDKLTQIIKESLSIENSEWLWKIKNKQRMFNTQRFLHFYKDGKGSLILPRGYLSELTKILKDNEIDFDIQKEHILKPEIDLTFYGELRNYQQTSVDILLKRNEGVLCAPTGGGKTIIALKMIEQRRQPTIILVHTIDLVKQWIQRIKTFLHYDAGIIGDGNFDIRPVTVSTVQSLIKHLDILENFGYLINDECHKTGSRTYTDIISNFRGKYINGYSATPFRNDGLDKVIEWYCGNILYKIEPQELIKEGKIVGIEPIIRKTFFNTQLSDPAKQYSKLLSEISKDEARNQMIADDVIEEIRSGSICLILSDRKDHCRNLLDLIPDKFGKALLMGDVDSSERDRIIADVNNGKIRALVATSKLIGEGFDCNNLSAVFLTMPIKYAGNIIQYLGRVMRPKEGKDRAYVYDYLDVSVPIMYGSFNSRLKVYEILKVS